MNKITLIFLLFTSELFTQWTLDTILPIDSINNPVVQEVCIIDSTCTWIFAVNNIVDLYPFFYKKNKNGWSKILHDLNPNINGRCITAIDSLNIWLGTSYPEEIYYSSNGGINWSLQYYISDTAYVEAITFDKKNKKTGYAFADIGHNGMWSGVSIIKTTNYGQNWTKWDFEYYGFSCADRSICVLDSNYAWFGVMSLIGGNSKIIHTTNGGLNWFVNEVNAGLSGPFTIQFSEDNQTGLFVGQTSPTSWFYRTTNTGLNWNIVYSTSNYYSKTMVWVLGTSNIYGNSEFNLVRSTNSGLIWSTLSGGPGSNLQSLDAVRINNSTIYALAVTNDRKVYKLLDSVRVIGIENTGTTIPKEYKLYQNYPNPFNPVTSIKYTIPKDDFVSLKIYDLKGELVTTLVNENQIKGEYEVSFNGEYYSSGVYFYVLESGQFIKSKKMVLIK
jgi:photosystem II stability/assembly factor-like uncharacterized protein